MYIPIDIFLFVCNWGAASYKAGKTMREEEEETRMVWRPSGHVTGVGKGVWVGWRGCKGKWGREEGTGGEPTSKT